MKHLKTFESHEESNVSNKPWSDQSHRTANNFERVILNGGGIDEVKSFLEETDKDINFENGIILRLAFKNNDFELAKFYVDNGGDPSLRRNMALKWAAEHANMKALEFLYDYCHIRLDEKAFRDLTLWTQTSDKKTDDEKAEVYEFIKKFQQ